MPIYYCLFLLGKNRIILRNFMFVCCKYTCKYLRCRTSAISLGLVFTLPSVPFYCWKNVPGGSWGWAKSFQSCWEPTGFIIPAPGEGEHGMEGARQEMGIEKNIFTEHRVVIASGLRWVANNFVCVGQNQGINYPQPLEMGCIGNGWESSTPKFSVWQEIPALCFVLGSCLCFFLSPKGMWGRRFCEAVERFVTTNCVDSSLGSFRNSGDKSSLFSLKQHKVHQTSPSRSWRCSTQSPRKTGEKTWGKVEC